MEREYWSGNKITSLKENEIFVFGSNPILSSIRSCPLYYPKIN